MKEERGKVTCIIGCAYFVATFLVMVMFSGSMSYTITVIKNNIDMYIGCFFLVTIGTFLFLTVVEYFDGYTGQDTDTYL